MKQVSKKSKKSLKTKKTTKAAIQEETVESTDSGMEEAGELIQEALKETRKKSTKKTAKKASKKTSEVETSKESPSLQLAKSVALFLDSKKATGIRLIDLTNVNPYFGIFLIATANSQVHLKSLTREVQKNFEKELPHKGSGYRPDDPSSGWVLIDFIDVVVHLFIEEQRNYYNLERLWGDAPEIKLDMP